MVKKIKHVVLNRPKRMVATNDDPTIGTQENPYTLEEFNWLVMTGEWPGGWVEFFGFVPWNLEDWYGSFSSSDSDCTSSSEEENNPGDGDGGLGLGGNGDENGENGNQGGENHNGNQGGENVGGGNGESGENENIGDGYNEPANTSVTGGWCFYNCIAYAYNYINFLAGVNPIKAKDVLNAYVTYLNNTNSGSGGLSQEELSYEIFYGPKFFINNDINSDIISFINQYFTTNSEGWATSSEEIQLCINSTVVSTLCLGILGTTERGHAVFVQSFSDNEYTCFDPSVDLTYTVPSYMLKCVLRLSIRLSMPVF